MRRYDIICISIHEIGWRCWIQANQLIVQLGTDPDIHPGSRISLLSSNDIQQPDSIENNVGPPQSSTTIVDDVTYQVKADYLYKVSVTI